MPINATHYKTRSLQVKTEPPIEARSSRQWSRWKLVSGYLGGQRTLGDRLSDISLTNSSCLRVQRDVAIVISLRVLRGQVFPQGRLPGKLGVASGAWYLDASRGGRTLAAVQSRFVPATMGRQIRWAREPLVALGTSVFNVGYPGAPVLRQLERVLVQLPAEFALVRPEPVFNLGQLRACLLGDFNDVKRRIDVAGDHRFVGAQDHGAGHRAARVLVELQPPGVLLLRPLQKLLGRACPGTGRGAGVAGRRGWTAIFLPQFPSGALRRRRCTRRRHGRVLHPLQMMLRR